MTDKTFDPKTTAEAKSVRASSRRLLRVMAALLCLFAFGGEAVLVAESGVDVSAHPFVHPGMLHSAADLQRIKIKVAEGAQPWAEAWVAFTNNNRWIAPDYMPRPLEIVGRGVGATGMANISGDCTAAYYNAIAWVVTGEERYAKKSVEVMNAWSYKCKEINGKDAVLCAGIYGYKLMNAAEIIRSTYPGWKEADIAQFKHLARDVFYPVIKDFATFANGNWDGAADAAMISIGVFLDDREMFDRSVRYYLDGSGDGSVLHYVINDAGQIQETGRDQMHTQLGIGLISCVAEMAWHQGVDLYSAYDNRLLKGFEYTAKYNLGEDVPFEPTTDRTGKYVHQRASVRAEPRVQVFEMVYNHYVNRAGVPAPYTARAAAARRPESLAVDQVGGGTLLFSLPPLKTEAPTNVPAIPGPIIAKGLSNGISLLWAASVGADSYTVKRAANLSGPFTVIAKGLTNVAYFDATAPAGKVFYYMVFATNEIGSGKDTLPVGASAGLPKPWAQQDVGNPAPKGCTFFDGTMFTLEGGGTNIGGVSDQFHFASAPLTGDGTIIARYVPQTPAQFAKMGLMMRESNSADSPYVGLFITPEATEDIEVPHWHLELSARSTKGAETVSAAVGRNLPAPLVMWGRMMSPFWLRLSRVENIFTASFSSDGQTWTLIGSTNVALKPQLETGLAGCSRIKNSTTMMFDHVNAPGWKEVNQHSPGRAALDLAQIESPDGKVSVAFSLQSDGAPAYAISYQGKPLVLESRLGFEPAFTNGFRIAGTSTNSHAGNWTQVYGERKTVPDNYRELNVDLKHKDGALMRLTFRAYDEGAAFRYSFPKQEMTSFTFTGELTEFRFPENTFGYEEHGTEGEYRRAKIADIRPWCERPLTLEYASGACASLAEAANQNYPRMLLSPLPGNSGALVSALGGHTSNTANDRFRQRHDPTVKLAAGDSTPWRMLIVGNSPGDLLERNYLMLNLNPPCVLADTSWIKPGKAMRDGTLTTANSKAIIDFAAKAGLQYVHLDARWYGSEDVGTGDATTARARDLDIAEIVRYGREHNVRLLVYVDRRQAEKQRDVIFPLYEKWGVAGVKLGFVNVGPQTETAWITETIQKAAEHHLMVNIHDGYRSTGLSRTWPNLMTVEGIRGNENMPTAEHNCTLPFTRYIAGPGDYTVCYYNNRVQTTHAHQLALAVISYSPLQWLFWYDKPDAYHGEPEIEFFRRVPTVWDETKVVNGEIGKFATLARRSGEDWFIGTINGSEARTLKVPMTFLGEGKAYTAHIYSDNDSAVTRTKVGIATNQVKASTTLELRLKSSGGQAIWLTPVTGK